VAHSSRGPLPQQNQQQWGEHSTLSSRKGQSPLPPPPPPPPPPLLAREKPITQTRTTSEGWEGKRRTRKRKELPKVSPNQVLAPLLVHHPPSPPLVHLQTVGQLWVRAQFLSAKVNIFPSWSKMYPLPVTKSRGRITVLLLLVGLPLILAIALHVLLSILLLLVLHHLFLHPVSVQLHLLSLHPMILLTHPFLPPETVQ